MTRRTVADLIGTRRPRWWSRPDGRVAALSVLLSAASLAFLGTMLLTTGLSSAHGLIVAWFPVLLVMFGLTEGFVIHVRVRRGGHAMSVTEIPMILALLAVDPFLAVLARTLGGAAGLVLLRRQRGFKLIFNVALVSLQGTGAVLIYGGLAGPGAGLAGPREWLAAYAAMLGADLLAILLVTAVICLHDDPTEWRRLPSAMRGLSLVVVSTSIALISALAVAQDPWAVTLLAVVSCVIYLGYRGYVRQSQGHAQVEQLYAFTSALDSSLDMDQLTRVILDRIRDELRGTVAELIVPADRGRPGVRLRLSGHSSVAEQPYGELPTDAWWLPAAAGQPVLIREQDKVTSRRPGQPGDGMAVPVPVGDGVTAVLLVTDSLPDVGTFTGEHLRLLQAMANHASVALANARLVERLRDEVSEKEHLALHDPLTGLPNRRQLHRLLGATLDQDKSRGASDAAVPCTAVMMMDLDRFKEINDALGHETGDALLREIGNRLRRWLADRGTVARLGGDEFAMLVSVGTAEQAAGIAQELVRELERPVQLGHLTLHPRASIGIALAPDHGHDPGSLLRRADVAMYAAKESRSGVRTYQADEDRNSPQRLALIGDLRRAIENDEITLAFQPKVDPATGAVVGAEALARWQHREHGSISPDLFIPLAEHSGLIRPLTLHVLRTALRDRADWHRRGHDLHIAVNLSPNTLLDDTLPDVIVRLLAQYGVPASALTLEITETTLMADPTGSLATLDRLHGLGVQISIDDFGTGYSSLGRLRELPIHEVKIDKSFVQNAAGDHRDRALVRSTVELGHALGLQVVAEGVEDADTYTFLAGEGCDIVQGYFISEPLPGAEFTGWLQDSQPAGGVSEDATPALFVPA